MNKADLRTRKVTIPWRLAFIGYAGALIVATHWPGLDLGNSGPSDKSVHLYAFGIVPFLLWRTKWISRLSVVYLITLTWATLDEWSQGIEILKRSMTWQDLAANVLGITLVVTWIWAFKPVGGPGNRLRLRLDRYVFEQVFSKYTAWIIFLGVFLACAAPIALLWTTLAPTGIMGPLFLALFVWAIVTWAIGTNIWSTHRLATLERRECFACGESCATVQFDELGRGICAECGNEVQVGQWVPAPRPSYRVLMKLVALPMVTGGALILAGFLLVAITALVYDRLNLAGILPTWFLRLMHIMGQEKPLMQAVDFTGVFLAVAVAARVFRWKLAGFYDQPFMCRKCSHDLRGTPTSEGLGTCGECGHPFARAAEQAGVGYVEQ